jgi:hypothetical protein
MGKNAAFRGSVSSRLCLIVPALLASGALSLLCLAGPAAARRPVGKDGKIHACYRVKGKPKGALRVVHSARSRCRRGERKTSWSVAGSPAVGSQGAQGQTGASGSAGSDEAALKAQIGALSLRVAALEGVLKGVTNGDLVGMMGTLQGLTNEGLTSAVNSVAATGALCEQGEALTDQVNDLGSGVQSLMTVLGGTILGSIFGGVEIPAALESFNCPTS